MIRPFGRLTVVSAAIAFAAVLGAQETAPKAASSGDKTRLEAWQKASTPGEPHKKLDALVGTFDTRVRSWIDPSKPPEDSAGTSVNSWVLGGRYVEQQFEGTMMGEPFTGIGYTGYDNVQKKYVSVWLDTSGTGMIYLIGSPDASGKTIAGRATMWDPVYAKPFPVESKLVITDNDHHSFELVGKAPNGRMSKLVEIQYTRKKS
jgi:hypothetical protein